MGNILESYTVLKNRVNFQCGITRYALALRKWLKPDMDVKFWRTKKQDEIDFILIVNRQPIPIEVKSSWTKDAVPAGIKAFCSKYPKVKRSFTVTNKSLPDIEANGARHHFVDITDFENLLFSGAREKDLH